jgi:hypothetical protein
MQATQTKTKYVSACSQKSAPTLSRTVEMISARKALLVARGIVWDSIIRTGYRIGRHRWEGRNGVGY